jgi:hypothetical protein
MSNASSDTRQNHDQNPPSPHGKQSEPRRTGEGAASAMEQMISQGEQQRQALPSGSGSSSTSNSGTGQS